MQDQVNDVVVVDATVWSGQHPAPHEGWFAVRRGVISAVGTGDTKPPVARQTVDAHQRHVLPSFVDCHSHISAAALTNITRSGSHWRSKQDALRELRQLAATDSTAEWLVYFFAGWDTWRSPQPPTARELEVASGGRNVFLVCESLHRGILSESGLRTCSLTQRAHTRFMDSTRGVPNGIVWEELFSKCLVTVFDSIIRDLGPEGLRKVILAEAQRHLAYGITDAHDPSATRSMSQALQRVNGETALRISWSAVGENGPISSADAASTLDDYGDGPTSAKIFTDGAHRCAMCIDIGTALTMTINIFAEALGRFSRAPLRRLFEGDMVLSKGSFYRQGAIFSQQQLQQRVDTLGAHNERLKIHALGNHAVDMACDCIVEAGLTSRVCLEHATLVDDQNIEKLAKHQIMVSMQPGFIPHYGGQFKQMHLGRKYRGLAARSMLDAGVDLLMSSDNPCGPLDPLYNMRCAVERSLPDGSVYLERESVTPEEAVHAYTCAGTKGITGHAKRGIEAGAPADFVILSGDPFVHSTVVESTWMDGEPVFQRESDK